MKALTQATLVVVGLALCYAIFLDTGNVVSAGAFVLVAVVLAVYV